MSLNTTGFVYPAPGYLYPPSACNDTLKAIVEQTGQIPEFAQSAANYAEIYIASMICRTSSDSSIANMAWKIYEAISPFGYRPSRIFALVAMIAFGVSAAWHLWQLFRTRSWVMSPIIVGAGLELYGWAMRYSAYNDPLYYYIEQLAVLTIAPAFFSCSIYTLFQLMVNFIDPNSFFDLKPKKMMWFWIGLDISTLAVQGAGGGLAGTAGDSKTLFDIGSYIMLAGIILQLLTSITFTIAFAIYFRRMYRRFSDGRQHVDRSDISFRPTRPVGRFIVGIAVAEVLLIIRGIYRTAELAGGLNSKVARDQAALIALDAIPMILVMFMLNVVHPLHTLPRAFWSGKIPKHATASSADFASLEMAGTPERLVRGRSSSESKYGSSAWPARG